MEGLATIAAPADRNTGKNQPLGFEILTNEEYEAFYDLKKHIVWSQPRPVTGAAGQRSPTDWVLELRFHQCREELHHC